MFTIIALFVITWTLLIYLIIILKTYMGYIHEDWKHIREITFEERQER